jgi:hypothetical protein
MEFLARVSYSRFMTKRSAAPLGPLAGGTVAAALWLTGVTDGWLTLALLGLLAALSVVVAESHITGLRLRSRWRWDAHARGAYRRQMAPQLPTSRLRDGVDVELRTALRPLRVVRGANANERERLRETAGDDVRLEFLEEQPPRSGRPRLATSRLAR